MVFRHARAVARLVMVLGFVGLSFGMSSPMASADEQVTYSYKGNDFNQFYVFAPGTYSMCPQRCNISGSFTLSPPLTYPADSVVYGLVPNTYSFTDGVVTFTPENSSIREFEVGVNSSGAIDVWNIILDSILPSGRCEQLNTGGLNDVYDGSTIYGDSNCRGLSAPGLFGIEQSDPGSGDLDECGNCSAALRSYASGRAQRRSLPAEWR